MSIESLKQQARKHEQNEEWKKALDQYNKALAELDREEQVDIGLYNRVGDLFVRVGDLDSAVEHYDKAVDLYREAYLPNNAIAVCKKIIRNVPDRHRAYLVIGQIRAEQGFIPDARTNFLTYAERMSQAGDLDESFRALIEFADLAPDEIGLRLSVVDQMVANQRESEAVEQLKIVRAQYLKLGKDSDANDIESRILNLDPEADVSAVAVPTAGDSGFGDGLGGMGGGGFGELSFGEVDMSAGSEEELSFAVESDDASSVVEEAAEEAASDGPEIDADLSGFEIDAVGAEAAVDEPDTEPAMEAGSDFGGSDDSFPILEVDDDETEAEPLPMMGMDEAEEDATPLPTMDIDFDAEEEGEAEPLPTMDFDIESADDDQEDAEPLPTIEVEAGESEAATDLPMMEVDMDDGPAPEAPVIEASDAFEEALEDTAGDVVEIEPASPFGEPSLEEDVITVETPALPDEPAPAAEAPVEPAAPEPAAPEPPAAPEGGFVDLGAMILGDSGEKTTRFTVQYEEPTGDEEADFARMLSQFKDKVSENLDSSDVRAHYDLGTAYKEMGLLDEAISSFQAALRASADHLPTYELMGQTFMEMGQPEAAVKSLERALHAANTVEDELVGIYYYLGRAYEELENRDSAVEYYDRVFALDINFADVTERLRELR